MHPRAGDAGEGWKNQNGGRMKRLFSQDSREEDEGENKEDIKYDSVQKTADPFIGRWL